MTTLKLEVRFKETIYAGVPGIWINSDEHQDAIGSIITANAETDEKGEESQPWRVSVWDAHNGLTIPGHALNPGDGLEDNSCKAALHTLQAMAAEAIQNDESTSLVLIIRNGHKHVPKHLDLIQTIFEQAGGDVGVHIVILSYAGIKMDRELMPLFRVIDHDLPDRDERRELILSVYGDAGIEGEDDDRYPQTGQALEDLVDATGGNTRFDILQDCGICLVRDGKLTPSTLVELKSETLVSSTALTLMQTEETFAGLGGLVALKEDLAITVPLLKSLSDKTLSRAKRLAVPKGVLITGVYGVGKSHLAKALANETNTPGLELDVTALLGGYVGDSERNTRRAFSVIRAMSPCIVYVDEVEKVLPRGGGGRDGDGGVRSGMMALFLRQMQDIPGVFWILTANDVTQLHPALTRSERLDTIYFIDLPGHEAKEKIWEIYRDLFELSEEALPDDDMWTGAEIRSCCRKAVMKDISLIEAAKSVIPVATTVAEELEAARSWAVNRALDSETGKAFTGLDKTANRKKQKMLDSIGKRAPRRKVRRGSA